MKSGVEIQSSSVLSELVGHAILLNVMCMCSLIAWSCFREWVCDGGLARPACGGGLPVKSIRHRLTRSTQH